MAQDVDGFDFKMNISDKVFSSAVPIIQNEMPIPKLPGSGGATRAVVIDGRAKFVGVPLEEPRMADRTPEGTKPRREFHITLLSPPEYAALGADDKARLAAGVNIPGEPRGRSMAKGKYGEFSMAVDWPEAQEFRKSLISTDGKPLGEKQLHVTLSDGLADVIEKTKAPPTGDE
jgi:hypothetical protein